MHIVSEEVFRLKCLLKWQIKKDSCNKYNVLPSYIYIYMYERERDLTALQKILKLESKWKETTWADISKKK